MTLLDEVRDVCTRLAPHGWAELMAAHGLDLTAADLSSELAKPLPGMDRSIPGFEDFALEGQRGIEPGDPDRSLLYHALASPTVLQVDGADLGAFPTPAELEAVEDYVFGVRPPSLPELAGRAGGDLLAVAVFATEYRSAVDSVHRRHAQLCFARTGVARVGTREPGYDAPRRGFSPFVSGDPHAIRVLPARYSAWIAVQRRGDEASFGPMRFSFRARHPELFGHGPDDPVDPRDDSRTFWVPLHKLFDGPECVQGLDLRVDLRAHHVNEKLRRVHREMGRRGADSGWSAPDIDRPPFRFTDGIAEFSARRDDGRGLLVPVPHPAVVAEAVYQGRPLTFRVPPEGELGSRTFFLPTLELTADGDPRRAPEYLHVRTAPGEPVTDLNDLADPAARVREGDYQAQHYVDFTGDGWIEPVCPQLRVTVPRTVPAYSVVAAPDFFFRCEQRDVMEWWLQRVPSALRETLWARRPFTLADERIAPNLKLNNVDFRAGDPSVPTAGFREADDTVTAVVSLPLRSPVAQRPLQDPHRERHNPLPDGAAGVFAPGWDTSFDTSGGVPHLAAYGLGSPFPEDSKLCAALSTFWPAVAPDAGRSFSQVFPTVSPLTDEEIGSTGDLPWDGVRGPRPVAGADVVEYASFDHVDYVVNALAGRFTLALTGRVGTVEYMGRIVAMARAYLAVGVAPGDPRGKQAWNVLSFRAAGPGDADLGAAEAATGQDLGADVWRVEMYQPAPVAEQPADHRLRRFRVRERRLVLVGGAPVVLVRTGEDWQVRHV